jgi:hypothetical protein
MLAELLHYCESEKVRWIKRYELGKKCNMSGGNFNRALEWAENESFIKISDSRREPGTWISPNFKSAKRELHRVAKRNVTQGLPFARVAKPHDVIDRKPPTLHESVQVSDQVRLEVRDAKGNIKKTG